MIVHLYHVFLINKKKKAPSRTGGPHLVSSAQWNPLLTFISLPFTRRWLFFFLRQKKRAGKKPACREEGPPRLFTLTGVCVCVPAGPVNLSTSAQLVAPAAVVRGTLSITASELYFEVDEDEPSFKTIDPKVKKKNRVEIHWSRLRLAHIEAVQSWSLNCRAGRMSTSVLFLKWAKKNVQQRWCVCVFLSDNVSKKSWCYCWSYSRLQIKLWFICIFALYSMFRIEFKTTLIFSELTFK